ncbi:hypothetical protein [Parvularcula lutaonensis]|uniref:Uncharacterized protein n=1 Tax=Parvularcula lutaonensis TaxID=491923 RepID=A0ABV7M9S4_9PROT|nr:hypothetical protein [Parvularcula lutaonensis]GGY47195.1 hypothetical protein GCM10007148_15590 [Parvularcula lutaonensis]
MLLTYYLVVLLILAVWYGGLRLWQRKIDEEITEGARFEYEHLRQADPDLLKGLDEDAFRKIFARVETPRAPAYTFAAVAVFLVTAPLMLAVTAITIGIMERTGVIPQPAEQAQRLKLSADGIQLVRTADLEALQLILQGWGGFFSFFSLLLFWVVVFYAVMRRYHARRPGSLREEVLRSR